MDDVTTYITQLSTAQFIGVAGFFCYIAAFGALQLGYVDGNTTTYTLLNILAASLVAISLLEEFNLASALIQGSWIVLGFMGLVLRASKAWANARAVLNATLEAEA